jgi:hypothetical protein
MWGQQQQQGTDSCCPLLLFWKQVFADKPLRPDLFGDVVEVLE